MKKGKDYIGVGCGAVIINDNNQILLLQRRKPPETGHWAIPGGTVEYGEKVEDAIVREVKEELGVKVQIIKLLGITNHIINEDKTHWVSPAYLVKIVYGIPVNREPENHSELKWFDIEKLPANSTMTALEALERYKELQ